jgi:signal transduction histidine kinase/ActR/RegA family two-component response regulator
MHHATDSALARLRRTVAWIAPAAGTPIESWRRRILAVVLLSMCVLGLLAYIPSVWLAWQQGERTVVIIDTIAYGVLVLVLLVRALPYAIRAGVVVVLPAVLGTYFLAAFGFEAAGFIWLMAFPIMGAVLLGLRTGVVCLILLLGILIGFAQLIAQGTLSWANAMPNAQVMWTVSTISVMMLCSLCTLSIGVLFAGLGDEAAARLASERESERLALAVNQSGGLVLLANVHGEIVYANTTARALLGDVFSLMQYVPWPDVLRGQSWDGSFDAPLQNGDLITLSGTASPVRDDGRSITHVLATLRDVRRERALESRVQQGQKLEAIGTLAGGIAHDFNNLLQPIVLNTESVQAQLPESHGAQPLLHDIRQSAERARALVRRILTFTRSMEHERTPVDLVSLFSETERLLRSTLPANITVSMSSVPGVTVRGEAGEVQQVLLNLATNAAHAMPEGGVLQLDVGLVATASDGVLQSAFPADEFVASLTVTDNGEGMSPETLARAFDPFFTTKGPGRGTGLGLAMVHGTVTALGGIIVPRSVMGVGTSMRVFLPLAAAVPEATAEAEHETPLERRFRVLVVDDEPAVLAATTRLLMRLDWDVEGCLDPVEALSRLGSEVITVDCLLTDLSMPGMSGLELARTVHAMQPSLPIILTTGYLEHSDMALAADMGIVRVLPKPFSSKQLQQALAEVSRTNVVT